MLSPGSTTQRTRGGGPAHKSGSRASSSPSTALNTSAPSLPTHPPRPGPRRAISGDLARSRAISGPRRAISGDLARSRAISGPRRAISVTHRGGGAQCPFLSPKKKNSGHRQAPCGHRQAPCSLVAFEVHTERDERQWSPPSRRYSCASPYNASACAQLPSTTAGGFTACRRTCALRTARRCARCC